MAASLCGEKIYREYVKVHGTGVGIAVPQVCILLVRTCQIPVPQGTGTALVAYFCHTSSLIYPFPTGQKLSEA